MSKKRSPETQQRLRKRYLQRLQPQAKILHASLYERFPNTFFQDPSDVRPLKTGIAHDIRALHPEQPSKAVSLAIHMYTRQQSYLRAVAAGKTRVDLDGNDAGEVTEAGQQQARETLKRLHRRPRASQHQQGIYVWTREKASAHHETESAPAKAHTAEATQRAT